MPEARNVRPPRRDATILLCAQGRRHGGREEAQALQRRRVRSPRKLRDGGREGRLLLRPQATRPRERQQPKVTHVVCWRTYHYTMKTADGLTSALRSIVRESTFRPIFAVVWPAGRNFVAAAKTNQAHAVVLLTKDSSPEFVRYVRLIRGMHRCLMSTVHRGLLMSDRENLCKLLVFPAQHHFVPHAFPPPTVAPTPIVPRPNASTNNSGVSSMDAHGAPYFLNRARSQDSVSPTN